MAFAGFPRRVRSTPVPNPFFGPLLEQIDDLAEFKCILRIVWALHQKRGYPRFVSLSSLLADRTLTRALSDGVSPHRVLVESALERAVDRGVLISSALQIDGGEERIYMLNSETDRRSLSNMAMADDMALADLAPMRLVEEAGVEPEDPPNIFALYEDNIGMLSPMMADELRDAEQTYPTRWIDDAFREAVVNNKRNWRYVLSILERWDREGRGDGEPSRHTKAPRYR